MDFFHWGSSKSISTEMKMLNHHLDVRNSGNRSFVIGSHGFSWNRRKIITWAAICQAIQIEQKNIVTHFCVNQHGKYSIKPIFFIATNMWSVLFFCSFWNSNYLLWTASYREKEEESRKNKWIMQNIQKCIKYAVIWEWLYHYYLYENPTNVLASISDSVLHIIIMIFVKICFYIFPLRAYVHFISGKSFGTVTFPCASTNHTGVRKIYFKTKMSKTENGMHTKWTNTCCSSYFNFGIHITVHCSELWIHCLVWFVVQVFTISWLVNSKPLMCVRFFFFHFVGRCIVANSPFCFFFQILISLCVPCINSKHYWNALQISNKFCSMHLFRWNIELHICVSILSTEIIGENRMQRQTHK